MSNIVKIFEEIVKSIKSGKRIVLVTIVDAEGSTPRGIGAKMVVKENLEIVGTIGGGIIEAEAIALAKEAMETKKILRKNFDLNSKEPDSAEPICGGKLTILVEPIEPQDKLIIFGAGHIAQALVKISEILSFQIYVVDDRLEFANRNIFPTVFEVLYTKNWDDVFEKLQIDSNTYIVIVTKFHKGDEICLRKALKTDACYIGMIGSKAKARAIKEKLLNEGFSNNLIEQIHCPVGLKIGGDSPEEIAVSIAAELVQTRNKKINTN